MISLDAVAGTTKDIEKSRPHNLDTTKYAAELKIEIVRNEITEDSNEG